MNSSLLSKLVQNLLCSHFSFSHPPVLVPCSPFPVLVTSQCFTVTVRPRRKTAKFYLNSSLLSKLVQNLLCSHFSFSHPPVLVPCSPFPVLVTSQCFTVTVRPRRKTAKFYFYGGLKHMTTTFFFLSF